MICELLQPMCCVVCASFFCAFVLVSSRVFEMMMFVTSFVIAPRGVREREGERRERGGRG